MTIRKGDIRHSAYDEEHPGVSQRHSVSSISPLPLQLPPGEL